MRNIYKPTWSGSSSSFTSSRGEKISYLSSIRPVADGDPNGTNSSFETNNSFTSSVKGGSKTSQPKSHQKQQTMSVSKQSQQKQDGHSVHFVPAFQEAIASAPTATTSSADETSWDAIIETDPCGDSTNSGIRKASSVVVTPSSSCSRSLTSRSKFFKCQPQQKQQNEEETRSVSVVSSSHHARSASASTFGGSNRIARLASLFASRAILPANTSLALAPASSPPASESSSGYVGWPGTQDKRGGTVVAESSYEESETGVAGGGTRRRVIASTTRSDVAKSYDQEVQEAVDRQLQQWMTSDSASEASTTSRQQSSQRQHAPLPPARDPAGYYMTGSKAPKTPPRPTIHARAEQEKIHRLNQSQKGGTGTHTSLPSPLDGRINSVLDVYGRVEHSGVIGRALSDRRDNGIMTTTDQLTDPSEDTTSDLSTSYSKTSSAYFNTREVQAIKNGKIEYGALSVLQNREAAAAVMRRFQPTTITSGVPSPTNASSLTEETLAMKDKLQPPGFHGLFNKTQEVPNLIDDIDSDSTSAASAAPSRHSSTLSWTYENNYRAMRCSRNVPSKREHVILEEEDAVMDRDGAESDVFDGISASGGRNKSRSMPRPRLDVVRPAIVVKGSGILGATSRAEMENLNLALLGGGLTAIQTTADDFTNRKTASDFDECLTNSDCDQDGFTKIPDTHEMIAAGKRQHDRSLSTQSILFLTPSECARRLLEKHRRGQSSEGSATGSKTGSSLFSDAYPSDKERRPFCEGLSRFSVDPGEMRKVVQKFRNMSRNQYPRLDYEDLEREEDATKVFALSEMRSRIMEADIERGLERRGGTTVVDDIVMTPRNRAALRVRDAVIVAKAWRDGATPQDVINAFLLTRRGERTYYIPRLLRPSRDASNYTWEEVTWVDDTDLSQYRCHSIGPRHLKGFEMFTIGDCQSMLLKLCNDSCQELRRDLNKATAQQIDAEEALQQEGETADGMMTEAEMTYINSMEEVKTMSHKLVLAEKSFALVKDRIQKLVAKYEALLLRFENETQSIAPSSIFSYESSYYSDDISFTAAEERERHVLARRAQRAELRAELAAREALLARQHANVVLEDRQKELNDLKVRLEELRSESSAAITHKTQSVVLARAITASTRDVRVKQNTLAARSRINREKINAVKQRFRDRSAIKVSTYKVEAAKYNMDAPRTGHGFRGTVGEEMFQHLDFYERSLRAVEKR